ncbi:MAG: helicase-related protein, partial [Clostridium sp.]|nr:helicase-related protein [Clostridium sp.]
MDIAALGFVFELGFNMGIVSCLPEVQKASLNNYLRDSSYLRDRVYATFTKNLVDEVERETVRENIDYLLFKGLLSGSNCFNEWIKSKARGREYKVEYFQANFYKVFDEDRHKEEEESYYIERLKKQLEIDLSTEEIKYLFQKGEALKADTILLISMSGKYHLCVIDNAVSIGNIIDFNDLDRLKGSLTKSIFNKRIKSNFSNLAVDSSDISDLNINQSLGDYILGIGKKDKPLFKMVQAGSYAQSFINLLISKSKITKEQLESICIIGYTDEEVCSINLNNEQLDILDMCHLTYQTADRQNKVTELEEKRRQVFSRIKMNFKRLFDLNQEAMEQMIHLKLGLNRVNFKESFEDYQNTAALINYEGKQDSFRNTHANQITKYIGDKSIRLLFLTGNPGIGKTTAIIEYLKNEEGYLFVYVSPRTQVNQDIEEKFSVNQDELYHDEAVYLTANGNDESKLNGEVVNVINFKANQSKLFTGINKPVMFLDNNRIRNFKEHTTEFENINTTLYKQVDNTNAGVLKRLTEGINYVVSRKLSDKIIATAAIQSLKAINQNKTTAQHFSRIFDTIYNDKTGSINEQAFREFAKHYPNVIFMVDEITGDESGAAFLDELIKLTFRKIHDKLPEELKELVNFKIVVADASITNVEVIQKHLKDSHTDSDKVYFKKHKDSEKSSLCIEQFDFKNRYQSVCINTNSYPAKKLHLEYELFLNVKRISDIKEIFSKDVIKSMNDCMAKEAIDILHQKRAQQVIIYVQDIARLEDIESKIQQYYMDYTNKEFIKKEDYIIINSSLSESERKKVSQVKDKVKVVLMTSSASRGISFKNATVMLVDMPKFDIEKNIMEILQLIYRGRGDEQIDLQEEKYVKFYIGDNICSEEVIDEQKVQQHLVSLFTLLMILKGSILTRIYGKTTIGKQEISLVPVGGKGIGATSDTLIESFSSLMRNLQKEYFKDRSNKSISELMEQLNTIFGDNVIQTQGEIYNQCSMQQIRKTFWRTWDSGIENLLAFKPFKEPMILGDMMLFKLDKQVNSFLGFERGLVEYILEQGNTIRHMLGKAYKDPSLSQQLKSELKKAGDTLRHFRENNKQVSMSLKDTTQANDRFVAMLLVAPFVYESFKDYKELEQENTFKSILQSYVKAYYSIGDVLPISDEYEDFPFITFRSA